MSKLIKVRKVISWFNFNILFNLRYLICSTSILYHQLLQHPLCNSANTATAFYTHLVKYIINLTLKLHEKRIKTTKLISNFCSQLSQLPSKLSAYSIIHNEWG